MGIADRLVDAQLLWQAGRVEGAFLSVLVAVAAAARMTFPAEKSDRLAFEQFVSSASRVKISAEFRGKLEPIEHIIYVWLRCNLVHEATIPFDIQLVEDPEPGVLWIQAGGGPGNTLKLSFSWFYHLFRSAAQVLMPVVDPLNL
jgi:hypothetical protein